MLRAKDDSAITVYLDENPSSGELLVAGLLSISHETPYSHTISPATLDLIKKYTTSSSLISTIMSFWRDRPSTATVLVMKYVDMRIISLADVISWLLEQDSWMRKSWGWEIIQICSDKANGRISRQFKPESKSIETKPAVTNSDDKEMTDAKPAEEASEENSGAEVMQIDGQNGHVNDHDTNKERKQMFEKVVEGVSACYERQSESNGDWLKEWFAMVVRRYGEDVAGLKATGWAGEVLAAGEEYRMRSS